jgi:hypothetical protein
MLPGRFILVDVNTTASSLAGIKFTIIAANSGHKFIVHQGSDIRTLTLIEWTQSAPETVVYWNHLTRISNREDFTDKFFHVY